MAGRLIISMTTIKSRLSLLDRVLSCLINQSLQPSCIELNVSQQAWGLDDGIELDELPPYSLQLWKDGLLEINLVPNIGPYRKLLPTLTRHRGEEFLVATVDDDVFYPPGWLAGLCESFAEHRCICAYRCRKIIINDRGLAPYKLWRLIDLSKVPNPHKLVTPNCFYLPTGRGGILYHSSFFKDIDILDDLRQLAPTNDDLGMKFATWANNIPVFIVPYALAGSATFEFPGIDIGRKLWDINEHQNDNMLAALWDYTVSRNLLNCRK